MRLLWKKACRYIALYCESLVNTRRNEAALRDLDLGSYMLRNANNDLERMRIKSAIERLRGQ